jgi:demethylmenaquinone methyltransferase/2-methoxy-6-polyprenyl-1,4-benzoquinol methylase
MTTHLKREFFNGIAAQWDGFPNPPDRMRLDLFVRRAVPARALRILDVGCGTGVLLDSLRASAASGIELVELDLAEKMLIQNRLKSIGPLEVRHVCADARRLPFPAEVFDVVLCFNALPHMAPCSETLGALLDCLRPGGILSVCHLSGSENLNKFHAEVGGAVAGDHLPSATFLATMLRRLRAKIVSCEEAPDWYLVQARRLAP